MALLMTMVVLHLFVVAKPETGYDAVAMHLQVPLLMAEMHRWLLRRDALYLGRHADGRGLGLHRGLFRGGRRRRSASQFLLCGPCVLPPVSSWSAGTRAATSRWRACAWSRRRPLPFSRPARCTSKTCGRPSCWARCCSHSTICAAQRSDADCAAPCSRRARCSARSSASSGWRRCFCCDRLASCGGGKGYRGFTRGTGRAARRRRSPSRRGPTPMRGCAPAIPCFRS